jgi:MFS family permease
MTDGKDGAVGWAELLSSRHFMAVTLVCVGVWLHAADSLIVATMMPSIIAEVGGERFVAWTFALYETGSIVAGAASGLVALSYGLRRPMVVAALLFAIGCLVSAAAPSMPVLLAGRAAQGLGGGGLVAMAFVSVPLLFPPRLMPRAMAAMSLVWGASAFLGPLIGGVFVTHATWRGGFVFFGVQALVLGGWIWIALRRDQGNIAPAGAGCLPVWRLVLLCLAVLGVAYAGVAATSTLMVLSLLAGLGALVFFAIRDAKSGADRLLPLGAVNPATQLGAAIVMVLAMSAAAMGLTTYGPLLMSHIHGSSPLLAGYIVALSSIGWSVAAVLVSGSPARRDPLLIALGMIMVVLSGIGLLISIPNGPVWLIAVSAGLEGAGFGLAWTFILRRATSLAPEGEVERLTAALPTVSRLGYALGASAMGIFANVAGFDASSTVAEAQHVARIIFAGSLPIAVLALLATIRFVGAPR